MKVGKIINNSVNLNKNSNKTQKAKTPLSQIQFKGYTEVQSFYMGTSGSFSDSMISWRNVNTGIEKITPLNEKHCTLNSSYSNGHDVYDAKCKIYHADINEEPDIEKLKKDNVDFLVEYKKPDDIYLIDIQESLNNGVSDAEKIDKMRQYNCAWRNLFKEQLNSEITNIPATYPESRLARIDMKALKDKITFYDTNINALEEISGLISSIPQNYMEYIGQAVKLEEQSALLSAETAQDESLMDSLKSKVQLAESDISSKKGENSELYLELAIAKARIRQTDERISSETGGKYNTLEEKINDEKTKAKETKERLEELTNSKEYKEARAEVDSVYGKVKEIYEKEFPELMQ